MTLSYDQRKAIYDFIANSYDIPATRGQTLKNLMVTKVYRNQDQPDAYPRIVMGYTPVTIPRQMNSPLTMVRAQERRTDDEEHKYRSGINEYTLDVEKAKEITEVKGTVSGSTYIFLSSEYQLDTTNNEVEFLGPSYPDVNTTFYVSYTHETVRTREGREVVDTLELVVYARDKTPDDEKDPPPFFVNGTLIAESIAHALIKRFNYYFDRLLEARYNMMLRNISDVVDLDIMPEGSDEWDRKRRIEVQIAYIEEELFYDPTIETTEIQQVQIIRP